MSNVKTYIAIGIIGIALIYGIATFDWENPGEYNQNIEWMPDMDSIVEPTGIWIPDPRLSNSNLWKRVGMYRYECEFLKLAIGCTDKGQYILIEMEGQKRVLAVSYDYGEIQKAVTQLTLKKY